MADLSLRLSRGRMALLPGVPLLATRFQKVAARWIEDGEGLKEDIAAERGPWRASQPEQSQIFYSTLRDGTARGSLVYLD